MNQRQAEAIPLANPSLAPDGTSSAWISGPQATWEEWNGQQMPRVEDFKENDPEKNMMILNIMGQQEENAQLKSG